MRSYKTLDQWKRDLELLRQNPNDLEFLAAIKFRFSNSNSDIQDQIKKELVSSTLAQNNALAALSSFVKSQTKAVLIVNSKEDPWFKC